MPSEWQYHADGVNTAVSTAHDLDGKLTRVSVEIDGFRVREWTDDELNEAEDPPDTYYDSEDDVHLEHKGGSHATVEFDVNGVGIATVESVTPEDGDKVRVRHMTLLPAAERVVKQLTDVDMCGSCLEVFDDAYRGASAVHIDALDP